MREKVIKWCLTIYDQTLLNNLFQVPTCEILQTESRPSDCGGKVDSCWGAYGNKLNKTVFFTSFEISTTPQW
jgi:hypothetical protein